MVPKNAHKVLRHMLVLRRKGISVVGSPALELDSKTFIDGMKMISKQLQRTSRSGEKASFLEYAGSSITECIVIAKYWLSSSMTVRQREDSWRVFELLCTILKETLRDDTISYSELGFALNAFIIVILDENNSKLQGLADTFQPVISTRVAEAEAPLRKKLGGLLRDSLSPTKGGVSATKSSNPALDESSQDLKGRYYYDKFGFTPFDAEKHLALRKAYIEGLVWNLEYYYKGCVSWEWYYPYHYGPMLSDLVNINAIIDSISFFDGKEANNSSNMNGVRQVAGEPLRPFEQLLGCLPPSSSNLLPAPMRWLMTDKTSPLKE